MACTETSTCRVDEALFRAAFAQLPTAVCVLAVGAGCARRGVTVGTVASLSLEPPLLMVALKRESSLLARLEPGTDFSVNVLGAGQEDVAKAFARPGIDRFSHGRWLDDGGVPRLHEASAWLSAQVRRAESFGDHVLVVGAIVHARAGTRPPLIYVNRGFTSAGGCAGDAR